MQALVENKVWTEAELMALPDDGRKYELVEGEIVVGNTGIEHEYIGGRLFGPLSILVYERRLGIVCGSSAGYWMKSGNLRSPDLSFISKERLRGLKHAPKKFFDEAPDLAVEVVSEREDVLKKAQEYLGAGTQLVWAGNAAPMSVARAGSVQTIGRPSGLENLGSRICRSAARALLRRERTVPMGTPSCCATAW